MIADYASERMERLAELYRIRLSEGGAPPSVDDFSRVLVLGPQDADDFLREMQRRKVLMKFPGGYKINLRYLDVPI